MDLQFVECGDMDWIELAQDRDRWRAHNHKLIGFYKRDEKCLLRGTDWVLNKAVCGSSLKG